LQSHIADERVRERLRDTRQSVEWLRPEDIAEWVCYAVCQPPRVNLAQIAVLPTQQPV
jgi:NADP-dependent 3-hydroxy acid dehydrogenase YdfG